MEKICPIMTAGLEGLFAKISGKPDDAIFCQQSKCQLWTEVYTTEGNMTSGCAYELKPHMNSEGQYRV